MNGQKISTGRKIQFDGSNQAFFKIGLCKPGGSLKKRKYKAHFVSKLTDAITENAETDVWLDFSKDCKYLEITEYEDFKNRNDEVGKMLSYMIDNPDKFI